jgi:hypothetical protein
MPMPSRVVERATREHGRIEDRRGPQRRAELIGPAPSNLVSPTNERLVRKTDLYGRKPRRFSRQAQDPDSSDHCAQFDDPPPHDLGIGPLGDRGG